MTEAPQTETVNLHGTTDAKVWADEFCKRWTTALCQVPGREGVETEEDFQDIMLGWFANAIMAGVDSVRADTLPASPSRDAINNAADEAVQGYVENTDRFASGVRTGILRMKHQILRAMSQEGE